MPARIFQLSYSASAQEYTVVPEPSSIVLLGTMGAVLAGKKLSGLAGKVKSYFKK